ncbi:hypothetical protein H6778_00420 [Candidatus Nomurabacteria bacterium]|nr:hypothetical protein [Candidatus Nomurabacteria bacterium]
MAEQYQTYYPNGVFRECVTGELRKMYGVPLPLPDGRVLRAAQIYIQEGSSRCDLFYVDVTEVTSAH